MVISEKTRLELRKSISAMSKTYPDTQLIGGLKYWLEKMSLENNQTGDNK